LTKIAAARGHHVKFNAFGFWNMYWIVPHEEAAKRAIPGLLETWFRLLDNRQLAQTGLQDQTGNELDSRNRWSTVQFPSDSFGGWSNTMAAHAVKWNLQRCPSPIF